MIYVHPFDGLHGLDFINDISVLNASKSYAKEINKCNVIVNRRSKNMKTIHFYLFVYPIK